MLLFTEVAMQGTVALVQDTAAALQDMEQRLKMHDCAERSREQICFFNFLAEFRIQAFGLCFLDERAKNRNQTFLSIFSWKQGKDWEACAKKEGPRA